MDEETIKLGVNATPQFIGALTEMVWAQIGKFFSPDFECLCSFVVFIAGDINLPIAIASALVHIFTVTDDQTETVSQDLESFAK